MSTSTLTAQDAGTLRTAAYGAVALLAAAGALYLVGGIVLTTTVNVPMNEALAAVAVPIDRAEAAAIWAGSAPPTAFSKSISSW